MLIENIIGNIKNYNKDDFEFDYVVLTHEELLKTHQRAVSVEGRDIAISLPRGETLFYGAVIYKDDNTIVSIDTAEEDVLQVYPKDSTQWARTAFNIGNMHHPAYIKEDSIMTPYDPIIERMFKTLGVDYTRETAKIQGIRANISQIGAHSHKHEDHSHGQ